MNKRTSMMAGVLSVLASATLIAGNVANTLDSGGQRTTSASYTIDGGIGGIGEVVNGEDVALKSGYVGQLTDVTNVAITAASSAVDEGDNVQLAGVATMDDASVTPLTGSEIAWPSPAYPVLSISPAGLAETMQVYAGTTASVTGLYLGVTGSGVFLVRDANPDNFGLYAGDQIPDGWQVTYFGPNNTNGLASAINATGQNNLYAYIADLCPTNPASCFEIVGVSNQPPNRVICFRPASTGRLYRLLYATNLVSGVWTNLPGATPEAGLGDQMSLSDTNAAPTRFYRVHVRVR